MKIDIDTNLFSFMQESLCKKYLALLPISLPTGALIFIICSSSTLLASFYVFFSICKLF